jgi:hypothetical protein
MDNIIKIIDHLRYEDREKLVRMILYNIYSVEYKLIVEYHRYSSEEKKYKFLHIYSDDQEKLYDYLEKRYISIYNFKFQKIKVSHIEKEN